MRDRASLFWTLAFPLVFIVLFGTIFSSGGGDINYKIGWVDQDGTAASASLHDAFASVSAFNLVTGTSTVALPRSARPKTILVQLRCCESGRTSFWRCRSGSGESMQPAPPIS